MKTDAPRKTRALAACLALACLVGGAAPAFAEAADLVATTNVGVITRDAKLEITGISEDVAGSVDEVRALTLVVQAVGQGALACQWSRTANGAVDPTFASEGFTCALADAQANTRYTYTASVSDETGATASAQVQVQVSAAPGGLSPTGDAAQRTTLALVGIACASAGAILFSQARRGCRRQKNRSST